MRIESRSIVTRHLAAGNHASCDPGDRIVFRMTNRVLARVIFEWLRNGTGMRTGKRSAFQKDESFRCGGMVRLALNEKTDNR